MKQRVKNIFFVVGALLIGLSSCSKENEDVNAQFADDPDFIPNTTDVEIFLNQENVPPCLYENNFLSVSVDSVPFSTFSWHIIQGGERLLMSEHKKQLLTLAADYELDYTRNVGVQIVDTTVKFSVSFCKVGITISDAFSPNGDGQFDVWKPITEGVNRYGCSVRNSKGELVYSTADQLMGWDGQHGGSKMPSGTYDYVVEGSFKNGRLFEYKGSFELIR